MLQKISSYWASLLLLVVFLPSCAMKRDQFGHAVMTGNLVAAKQTIAPDFARITIHETNGKYSVPIQYAIIQRNKEMATFLVQNNCHKQLDGHNLTYYCAINGYEDMARHFASLGEGSYDDIARAKRNLTSRRTTNTQNSANMLIGLGLLAMLASATGGSSSSGNDAASTYSILQSEGSLR